MKVLILTLVRIIVLHGQLHHLEPGSDPHTPIRHGKEPPRTLQKLTHKTFYRSQAIISS
jgi:hypothetical protein